MKTITVKLTLLDEMLGTKSNDPEVAEKFISNKAPDALSREEEIASIGVDAAIELGKTVFSKDENGNPFIWNYQVVGFFKDACSGLNRVKSSKSNKLKAYKKVIEQTIFVRPRKIVVALAGPIGSCQRPLRAQTAQGERIALANSETIPAGSHLGFDIVLLEPSFEDYVREWLDYGQWRGLGQWRNSGKGLFSWETTNG